MSTIFKHSIEVTPRPIVTLPVSSRIISFQVQAGVPTIWFICDNPEKCHTRTLRLVGTGAEIGSEVWMWKFIGTIQVGRYVWHLFDPGEDKK